MDELIQGYMHKSNNNVNLRPTVIKHASILQPDEYARTQTIKQTRDNDMYKEIIKLYGYCITIGIKCELTDLWDGYKIIFEGGDVVQHKYSNDGDKGCVEFAIGCRKDYCGVSLRSAKAIVKRRKDKLSMRKE